MKYAVHAPDGTVTRVLKTDDVPEGWISSDENVALGSTWSGGVFTPPAPPPSPTAQEIEDVVQAVVDDLTNTGNVRDKALAMLIADVVAKAFNISTPQARQMVRDRLVDHLRTINGI